MLSGKARKAVREHNLLTNGWMKSFSSLRSPQKVILSSSASQQPESYHFYNGQKGKNSTKIKKKLRDEPSSTSMELLSKLIHMEKSLKHQKSNKLKNEITTYCDQLMDLYIQEPSKWGIKDASLLAVYAMKIQGKLSESFKKELARNFFTQYLSSPEFNSTDYSIFIKIFLQNEMYNLMALKTSNCNNSEALLSFARDNFSRFNGHSLEHLYTSLSKVLTSISTTPESYPNDTVDTLVDLLSYIRTSISVSSSLLSFSNAANILLQSRAQYTDPEMVKNVLMQVSLKIKNAENTISIRDSISLFSAALHCNQSRDETVRFVTLQHAPWANLCSILLVHMNSLSSIDICELLSALSKAPPSQLTANETEHLYPFSGTFLKDVAEQASGRLIIDSTLSANRLSVLALSLSRLKSMGICSPSLSILTNRIYDYLDENRSLLHSLSAHGVCNLFLSASKNTPTNTVEIGERLLHQLADLLSRKCENVLSYQVDPWIAPLVRQTLNSKEERDLTITPQCLSLCLKFLSQQKIFNPLVLHHLSLMAALLAQKFSPLDVITAVPSLIIIQKQLKNYELPVLKRSDTVNGPVEINYPATNLKQGNQLIDDILFMEEGQEAKSSLPGSIGVDHALQRLGERAGDIIRLNLDSVKGEVIEKQNLAFDASQLCLLSESFITACKEQSNASKLYMKKESPLWSNLLSMLYVDTVSKHVLFHCNSKTRLAIGEKSAHNTFTHIAPLHYDPRDVTRMLTIMTHLPISNTKIIDSLWMQVSNSVGAYDLDSITEICSSLMKFRTFYKTPINEGRLLHIGEHYIHKMLASADRITPLPHLPFSLEQCSNLLHIWSLCNLRDIPFVVALINKIKMEVETKRTRHLSSTVIGDDNSIPPSIVGEAPVGSLCKALFAISRLGVLSTERFSDVAEDIHSFCDSLMARLLNETTENQFSSLDILRVQYFLTLWVTTKRFSWKENRSSIYYQLRQYVNSLAKFQQNQLSQMIEVDKNWRMMFKYYCTIEHLIHSFDMPNKHEAKDEKRTTKRVKFSELVDEDVAVAVREKEVPIFMQREMGRICSSRRGALIQSNEMREASIRTRQDNINNWENESVVLPATLEQQRDFIEYSTIGSKVLRQTEWTLFEKELITALERLNASLCEERYDSGKFVAAQGATLYPMCPSTPFTVRLALLYYDSRKKLPFDKNNPSLHPFNDRQEDGELETVTQLQRIAFEPLQPNDFMRETDGTYHDVAPWSQIRMILLKQQGWKVIPIHYSDWEKIDENDVEAQVAFLRKQLIVSLHNQADAYDTRKKKFSRLSQTFKI